MSVGFALVPGSWSQCSSELLSAHGEEGVYSESLFSRAGDQIMPSCGSCASVAHLIQISTNTIAISSGGSYKFCSTMEMQSQNCSSVFSLWKFGFCGQRGARFPPGEEVPFYFLKVHGNLSRVLERIWAEEAKRSEGVLLDALPYLQHCATLQHTLLQRWQALLKPLHASNSFGEFLIPHMDRQTQLYQPVSTGWAEDWWYFGAWQLCRQLKNHHVVLVWDLSKS